MHTGEFWPAVHRGECRFRKDRPATPKPAASEIDEAAAVERARWISNVVTNVYTKEEVNLARAALAWKARAEHSETIAEKRQAEIERLTRVVMKVKARAEAAEAERDSLRRQLAQAVKAR